MATNQNCMESLRAVLDERDAEIAELKKDQRRLEWADRHSVWWDGTQLYIGQDVVSGVHDTLRDAIDEAMSDG